MEKPQNLAFAALPFTPQQLERLAKKMKPRNFNKGDVLFHQGEVDEHIYLLHRGLVKLSYLTPQGKELIKSFLEEGSMVGSLYCLLHGGAASFSAIALEPVTAEMLPFSLFSEMIEENPELQRFAVGFFQQLALKKELREYELLCLSASERYQSFVEQHPELLGRIKQAELALYLGITPIALSRLKNRVDKVL